MNDPGRLKETPQLPAAVRHDLERVQGVTPVAYDTHAGLSRLQGVIAASTATAAIKTALWPWVTAVGVVSATLLGYVATQGTHDRASVSQTRSDVAPHATTVIDTATVAPASVVQPVAAIEPVAVMKPAAVDPDALLRQETANLARAREAIESSPADALRLAEQGERRFVGGMFGQERRAIIVLSSLRLGRSSAPAAARAFLELYPHSSLSDRIRDELSTNQRSP